MIGEHFTCFSDFSARDLARKLEEFVNSKNRRILAIQYVTTGGETCNLYTAFIKYTDKNDLDIKELNGVT